MLRQFLPAEKSVSANCAVLRNSSKSFSWVTEDKPALISEACCGGGSSSALRNNLKRRLCKLTRDGSAASFAALTFRLMIARPSPDLSTLRFCAPFLRSGRPLG